MMKIHDDENAHANTQYLKKRMQRIEFCLSVTVAVMILLTFYHWITASSMSIRVQKLDDKVFVSQRMMDDKISTIIEEEKAALLQLKQHQSLLIDRFVRFKRSKKISNESFVFQNKQKQQYNKKANKFAEKKSTIEFNNNRSKTSNYKQKQKKSSVRKERKLQIHQNSSQCDENLFQLSVRLGENPSETSWELYDSVNKSLIAYESYHKAEAHSFQTCSLCISDGSYVFTVFDFWRNAICYGLNDCAPYNISINNEDIYEEFNYDSKERYNINIYSKNLCVKNFVEVELKMKDNVTERSWELIDTKSNTVLTDQSRYINSVCVDDGVYLFSSMNAGSKNFMNNDYVEINVNGNVLIDGPLSSNHQFSIFNGAAQSLYCHSNPILNAMNDVNGSIYNERISKLLECFESLSSYAAVHDDKTAQYKAACYILHDDINNMKVEDDLTVERFVLYLFFISTEIWTWGEALPSDFCDVDGVTCDQDGHIIRLIFGKYNAKKKLFDFIS